MKKLVDIQIKVGDEATVYTCGPLRWGHAMSNDQLAAALGMAKQPNGNGAAAPDVQPGGYDLEDEDKPPHERIEAMKQATQITDLQGLVVTTVCGSVRKINGEPVNMTEDDVNAMDLQAVLALFAAIQQTFKLDEGGRFSAMFQILEKDAVDVGEGVSSVQHDTKPVPEDS
jgi:hypothetical protein